MAPTNKLKLSDHQWLFLQDLALLILYCREHRHKVTGGELLRTLYQQLEYLRTGKTKTKRSWHLKKMAIDLNFFIDGKLTYDKKKLQNIGQYWEDLSPYNRWGGNFKTFLDTNHFERRTTKRAK